MALPEVFQRVCDRNRWPCHGNQVEVVLEGGRKQTVTFGAFLHGSHEMYRAHTVVGKSDELSVLRLQSALSINFGLPHGALAIHQGQLVMADTFLIKDADDAEVEASIRFLAQAADRYEKAIFGTDQH